ncbi:MAG: relaxase/mobilization nuclease domain-containing protein [Proteobacteria bacterium]|nr:conjugal transfer protein TraI [Desulfobulbaceae bacterium]MBU4152283.1 relaxase/mobilization nuclease domain-containing protein [Pseudomonadota bacterium]
MIAKQVLMKTVNKSSIGGLVKYLTDEQKKNERVGAETVTNCQTDNPQVAVIEILNTQAQNTRATSDKTYHLIVSFRANEQPDETIMRAIETKICEGLSFGEHQRVSVVHHDTDNLHLHIAINKIHPTRYTLHDPYGDYRMLGQLCERLEGEFGLEVDNHQAQRSGSENRAFDMERHAGIESLLGWIKRQCLEEIQNAQSWAELHNAMTTNGLKLQERGNGLVIMDGAGFSVKASSVARDLSKVKLEQRFGAFEAISTEVKQVNNSDHYTQKPMRSRVNTVDLYARYKTEQSTIAESRAVAWAKTMERKDALIATAKRQAKRKRTVIKAIKGAGLGKKLLYAATNKKLIDEIQKINKQYLTERQELYDKGQRLAWADWLRVKATEGDKSALEALRARESAQGLKGNTLAGEGVFGPLEQDSITKKGTVISRVGKMTVRDDGYKLQITRGSNQADLETVLGLVIERSGNRIIVNGSADFKEQIAQAAASAKLPITFDDASLESRRQELIKITKEKTHNEQGRFTNQFRYGNLDGRRHQATTNLNSKDTAASPGRKGLVKPNIARIGQRPPPQSQNRLRGLSELRMVHFASRSEVLLPSDVPNNVELQGAQPNDNVRRNSFGPGLDAVDKYIAERETMRLKVPDVLKHRRFNNDDTGTANFQGIRQIEGQTLALLKRNNEIIVTPIDEKTARSLKRVALSAVVSLKANGSIKTKGRSR